MDYGHTWETSFSFLHAEAKRTRTFAIYSGNNVFTVGVLATHLALLLVETEVADVGSCVR